MSNSDISYTSGWYLQGLGSKYHVTLTRLGLDVNNKFENFRHSCRTFLKYPMKFKVVGKDKKKMFLLVEPVSKIILEHLYNMFDLYSVKERHGEIDSRETKLWHISFGKNYKEFAQYKVGDTFVSSRLYIKKENIDWQLIHRYFDGDISINDQELIYEDVIKFYNFYGLH